MSSITAHVLDTSLGRPAAGLPVVLEVEMGGGGWKALGRGATDADGRLKDVLVSGSLQKGTYRLTFDTGAYFAARKVEGLYPTVTVVFAVRRAEEHYHIPLLLSPFGYTTYRGS
jgi:5-hydroxyisourate hydrolase